MTKKVNIDWNNLGFEYIKTDFRYISNWKDGKWDAGHLTEDNMLTISEASCALHYGQSCFEGLKAYRTKEGKIQLFRPNKNAERLNSSLRKLLMPEIPEEKFIDACMQVVKANEAYIPQEILDKCEGYKFLDKENLELYQEVWIKVKS